MGTTFQNMWGGGPDSGVGQYLENPDIKNTGNMDWNLGSRADAANRATYSDFVAHQNAGMQPTIAQAQLKSATDQNIATQAALAASAHGAGAGTNRRLMMNNAMMTGQQGAQQNAILAAQQEQENAKNALTYQGQNNQFQEYLYGLANARDMGLAGVQQSGNIAAGAARSAGADRMQKFFQPFASSAASSMGSMGSSGGGGGAAAGGAGEAAGGAEMAAL